MIIYTEKNGFTYKDEHSGKEYELYEMVSLGGKTTSDMVAIWDNSEEQGIGGAFVNWFAGASLTNASELNESAAGYVREYEAKRADQNRAPAPISYKFTKEGTKLFIEDVANDIFSELDSNNADMDRLEFTITIGNRTISVPMFADSFDRFDIWLTEAEREWNE